MIARVAIAPPIELWVKGLPAGEIAGAPRPRPIADLLRKMHHCAMPPRTLLLLAALFCAGCTPNRAPPPVLLFDGLPVSGDRGAAVRRGFRNCFNMDAINVRCRRHGVTLYGHGPFEAAVDLRGSEGQSGFDHLTVWHDEDQRALYDVLVSLHRAGWRSCHTGTDRAGDQAIFTHRDANVRLSIDISYFGERRLRIFPKWRPQKLSGPCVPDEGLGLFGLAP